MELNYLIEGPVTKDIIAQFIAEAGEKKETGGLSVFLGQVRADEINGKKVISIEYSAYEDMVTIEADKIKKAVLSEYDDVVSIEIIHSTGIVRAGEISLLVLVSAVHRRHAIDGCSKTVELIKESLPVWKKEIFDDESHEWKQNRQSK